MATGFPHTFSVFLADDDADDRYLFEEALLEVRNDVSIITANNGEQLMFKLNKNSAQSPSVIFLDLNMPLKNGMECLQEIKADALLKNIPVIIFSTSTHIETINQVFLMGANYYICKPDSFQKLKLLLAKILSLSAASLNIKPSRDKFIISV